MFCPECGKQNADEAEKCAYCGAALEDNAGGRVSVGEYAKKGIGWIKTTALPFLSKHKKIGIPAALIVVLLIAFYAVGSVLSNPQRIVSQYVEGVKSGNWNSVYKLLDLTENDFVNEDQFAAYCKTNDNNYSDITSYNIHEQNVNTQMGVGADKGLIKTYVVSYVTSGATAENSFELKLVKQDGKTWLFYPKYKVSTQNMLAECTILTYPDSKVSLDGKELVSGKADENGFAVYKAAAVFKGEHSLKITHKLFESYEDKLNVSDSLQPLTVDSLKLKKDVTAELSSLTQSNFKLICEGAIAGKQFKDLGITFTKDSTKSEKLIEQYKNFAERIKKEDGSGLTSITLSDFSDKSNQSSMNNSMTYRCYLNFNYTYTSMYRYDEAEETSQGDGDGYVSVTYVYENDGWAMASIDNYSIYY